LAALDAVTTASGCPGFCPRPAERVTKKKSMQLIFDAITKINWLA
jgi:hypothetical protein